MSSRCDISLEDAQTCVPFSFPPWVLSSDLEINCARRSKRELETLRWWATYAWQQIFNWQKPVFLLPWWPSINAKLVQRDGNHHCWAWAVASRWSASTVSKLLLPFWKNRLLLPPAPFLAAWLHWPKAPIAGSYQMLRSSVWLLPQVLLWDELHRAVLGICEASISGHGAYHDDGGDGGKGGWMPWWCSPTSHLVVYSFLFSVYFSLTFILIRFANQSAQFMSAYAEGLTSVQASWANRKYHGYRTLPPEIVAYIKQTIPA